MSPSRQSLVSALKRLHSGSDRRFATQTERDPVQSLGAAVPSLRFQSESILFSLAGRRASDNVPQQAEDVSVNADRQWP